MIPAIRQQPRNLEVRSLRWRLKVVATTCRKRTLQRFAASVVNANWFMGVANGILPGPDTRSCRVAWAWARELLLTVGGRYFHSLLNDCGNAKELAEASEAIELIRVKHQSSIVPIQWVPKRFQ